MNKEECAKLLAAASGAALLVACVNTKQKRKRSCWVKPWIKRRDERSSFHLLNKELLLEDLSAYRNYLRMSEQSYSELLNLVDNTLRKQDTYMRKSISSDEKLSATLRFLATGESYQSLEYQTRLSKSFLCTEIPRVCEVIYHALKEKYLKVCMNKYRRYTMLFLFIFIYIILRSYYGKFYTINRQ